MEILIFIAYLLLVSFCITIIPFFKKSGLSRSQLLVLFAVKVTAGFAYARFYTLPRYFPGSDTWRFYRLSLEETKWLLHSPYAFFKDIFSYGYNTPGSIFSGKNTYWNDLKSNIIIKMLSVMNVFTHNSYYTNIILFNLLFFIGLVALYRLFATLYPSAKFAIIPGIFLLPSALFWCSGIHKDGLILSATGVLIYCFHRVLLSGLSLRKTVTILGCFLLLFTLRNYVFFVLIPALFCWWLCRRFTFRPFVTFAGVYTAGISAIFIIPVIAPSLSFPGILVSKQQEFLLLNGTSQVAVPSLQPSITSFVRFLPYAADMAFLRPHINEFRNLSYLPAIAEILLFLALVFASFFLSKKRTALLPIEVFFIFFSLSVLLICGYTIPFTGALVRYRSFILPLLITPLLCRLRFFSLYRRLRR